MVSNNFNIPFSLQELNFCLETCNSSKDVINAIGLKEFETRNLTLEIFLNAIVFPLESYSDINKENLNIFFKKINQLFPSRTSQESKALNIFFTKMMQKKLTSSSDQKSVLTYSGQIQEGGGASSSSTSVSIQAEETLKIFAQYFNDSAEVRLQEALNLEDTSTLEKKASLLQILLNFLIIEEDLFQRVQPFVDLAFQIHDFTCAIREGSFSVIRLSALSETTVFEIPKQFEENEELAFWLSFSSCFGLRKSQGKIYACIQPIERWKISIQKLEERLHDLRKLTHHKHIHFIIDKLLLCLKRRPLDIALFHKAKELMHFYDQVKSSALVTKNYQDSFEIAVTPAGYFLFSALNKQQMDILDKSRDFSIENFEDFKKIIEFWKVHRDEQNTLFNAAYKQLNEIIGKLKDRKKTLKFTKILSQKPGILASPLRKQLIVEGVSGDSISSSGRSEEEIQSKQEELDQVTSGNPSKQPNKPKELVSQLKIKKKLSRIDSAPYPIQDLVSQPMNELQQSLPSMDLYPPSNAPASSLEKSSMSQELPGSPFPFSFDERVERWHHYSFGDSLPQSEFPEYSDQSKSAYAQELVHVFHALHPFVDRFLALGVTGTWQNKSREKEDLRFVIPAEIVYKRRRYRGFIAYAVDEDDICYHKCFTQKVDTDILDAIINKSFNEHDFPELQKAVLSSRITTKPTAIQFTTATVEIDPIFGNVIIEDRKKELRIELFKVEPS
jgi:hypothetical protein